MWVYVCVCVCLYVCMYNMFSSVCLLCDCHPITFHVLAIIWPWPCSGYRSYASWWFTSWRQCLFSVRGLLPFFDGFVFFFVQHVSLIAVFDLTCVPSIKNISWHPTHYDPGTKPVCHWISYQHGRLPTKTCRLSTADGVWSVSKCLSCWRAPSRHRVKRRWRTMYVCQCICCFASWSNTNRETVLINHWKHFGTVAM